MEDSRVAGNRLALLAAIPDPNVLEAVLRKWVEGVLGKPAADATFCQRELCEQVVAAQRDDLFVVKDNQPELKAAVEAEFQPAFFSPRDRAVAQRILVRGPHRPEGPRAPRRAASECQHALGRAS